VQGGGRGGAEVSVTIPPGTTTAQIAAILDERGVIGNATLFRWYLRVKGGGSFQAGSYTLRRHAGYDWVVKGLRRGPEIVSNRLTIPEGFTLAQVAERVGR